jgi:threonine synthase
MVKEEGRFCLRRLGTGKRLSWSEFAGAHAAGRLRLDGDTLWEVDYDYDALRDAYGRGILSCPHPGILAAWPLLPLPGPDGAVSLHEGRTPLLKSRRNAGGAAPRVFLKNESLNPTGSFKDRYACVSVNVARTMGYRGVACASTGNHALAVAAYAAAAGMTCVAIVSDRASRHVLAALQVYGAETRVVPPARRFEDLAAMVGERLFPVGLFMPGPTCNPFGIEGYKSIAFELFDQLGAVPDAMVFPCARGNGLYGTWKGFRELNELGFTEGRPRMYACQPEAAPSLARAFERGKRDPVEVVPGESMADATCESVSSRSALDAIHASGGGAAALGEPAIHEALLTLGKEGLFVEPSSALAWAGMEELVARGSIQPDETAIVVLTSTGFKTRLGVLQRLLSDESRREGQGGG